VTALRRRLPSVLPALLALVLVGAVLAASPSSAASWSKVIGVHGSQVQACKVPVQGGWRLSVRLFNGSDHGHTGGVTVNRNGKIVDRADFTVRGRKISKVKNLAVRPGDLLIGGIGEADTGQGAGGDFSLGSIGRC
jgi:hypothetical protein